MPIHANELYIQVRSVSKTLQVMHSIDEAHAMELALKVLVGLVTTAAFLCLCCFAAQITSLKKTNWLYQRLHEREPRHLTYRQSLQRDAEKTYLVYAPSGL
jgi:hypothetical protein